MGRKGRQELPKLVIINPEALPTAQERWTRLVCDEYFRALREGRIKQSDE